MQPHLLKILSQSDHISSNIQYGVHATPFGVNCLLSILEDSICGLHLITNTDLASLLQEVQSHWKHCFLKEDSAFTKPYVEAIFQRKSLPLVVKGTPFQTSVLQSLAKVAFGEKLSYQALAEAAGHKAAVRAVATIVANNPISILLPCHRIIYKSGDLGNYRWGASYKKKVLDWEEEVSCSY